ncbi:MAG TPA: cytochrome P450, partial [Acidimicrobiales bacterium]|nr:cytochrome P450 [Acidimicrobiales bacterium]
EDMEVGGELVRTGEFSMLLIGSANRDPAVFADPETFDVTRGDNNHLGFGFGIHHCLGAPLARLEAQVALPALLRRARHIERTTDTRTYKENVVLRGLESLPVTLSA